MGTHDLSPIFQSVSHAYQLCNKVSKRTCTTTKKLAKNQVFILYCSRIMAFNSKTLLKSISWQTQLTLILWQSIWLTWDRLFVTGDQFTFWLITLVYCNPLCTPFFRSYPLTYIALLITTKWLQAMVKLWFCYSLTLNGFQVLPMGANNNQLDNPTNKSLKNRSQLGSRAHHLWWAFWWCAAPLVASIQILIKMKPFTKMVFLLFFCIRSFSPWHFPFESLKGFYEVVKRVLVEIQSSI